jgi:hypothetical protein
MNRRLYNNHSFVETAIYRVFVIMRFISLIDFDSNSGERIRIYAERSQHVVCLAGVVERISSLFLVLKTDTCSLTFCLLSQFFDVFHHLLV